MSEEKLEMLVVAAKAVVAQRYPGLPAAINRLASACWDVVDELVAVIRRSRTR
jgi:hypothetical protein